MVCANELRFLDALAAKSPTPAGGAAAAYAGAMAAALVALVARTTIGKPEYAAVAGRMEEIVSEAEEYRALLVEAVRLDSDAFDAFLAAKRLPAGSMRDKAVIQASIDSAEVPIKTAQVALQVLELAAEVAESGNLNAINDAMCAGWLAINAVSVSALNASANLEGLPASQPVLALRHKADKLLTRVEDHENELDEAFFSRTLDI